VTNTVTGIGGIADRKGEYFHREISVGNTNAPLWQTVNVGWSGCVSNGGFAFPAYTQSLSYDLDGNLTFDGIWTYEWDAENRLKGMSMTNISGLTVPAMYSKRLRLDFAYDYMGRRVQKAVSAWNGSTFTNASTSRFVYDGWNLIAVLNPQSSIQQAFLWGLDLSGTMNQAGGVGGLLTLLEMSNGQVSDCHFACYDANGNVTGFVKASDLSLSGRYEYSPFGEPLRATGPIAKANPLRFSTKFADDETGLVYYGYRYFCPSQARWLGRDPAGEDEGLNLMAFVSNKPILSVDTLGASEYRTDVTNVGVDIHDTVDGENITYGFRINEGLEGIGWDRGGVHAGQAPDKLVEKSIANIMQDEGKLRTIGRKISSNWGLWREGSNVQRMMRLTGRGVRRTLGFMKRGGTVAVGAVAILTIAAEGNAAAETARAYGRNMKLGERAYADLDAVDIATNIQNAGGNYFVTMAALDILLADH
jgi:RHS repeat-associated protein